MYEGKRVCMFSQAFTGGGAQRVLVNLMHDFVDRGIVVDLVLTHRFGESLNRIPSAVNVIDLGTKIPRKSVGPLVGYLKAKRPDAVMTTMPNTSIVALVARRLARVPTKVGIGIHNTISVETQSERSTRERMKSLILPRFYRQADHIAAVSVGVADDFASMTGIPRDRIDVIYNPVVTDILFTKAKEPVDHPWLAPGQPPVILTVGRLAPQKDHMLLIDVFAEVRARRPCRLMILGEGDERPKLEARVAELGIGVDVSLPGFVDNPFAYMARAGVFALTSKFEGLPTVLIEALACGTRVVSTDCPSGPREILAGGKYGRLVPMGDASALASALDESLERTEPVPDQAWTPYRSEVIAERYCAALLRN